MNSTRHSRAAEHSTNRRAHNYSLVGTPLTLPKLSPPFCTFTETGTDLANHNLIQLPQHGSLSEHPLELLSQQHNTTCHWLSNAVICPATTHHHKLTTQLYGCLYGWYLRCCSMPIHFLPSFGPLIASFTRLPTQRILHPKNIFFTIQTCCQRWHLGHLKNHPWPTHQHGQGHPGSPWSEEGPPLCHCGLLPFLTTRLTQAGGGKCFWGELQHIFKLWCMD